MQKNQRRKQNCSFSKITIQITTTTTTVTIASLDFFNVFRDHRECDEPRAEHPHRWHTSSDIQRSPFSKAQWQFVAPYAIFSIPFHAEFPADAPAVSIPHEYLVIVCKKNAISFNIKPC